MGGTPLSRHRVDRGHNCAQAGATQLPFDQELVSHQANVPAAGEHNVEVIAVEPVQTGLGGRCDVGKRGTHIRYACSAAAIEKTAGNVLADILHADKSR